MKEFNFYIFYVKLIKSLNNNNKIKVIDNNEKPSVCIYGA
jgi:hypothetical protein